MVRQCVLRLTMVLLVACSSARDAARNAAMDTAPAAITAEAHRPLIHFTPPRGWMNDPNGLVYLAGTWHLFYQHYPDSTVWGPMHWGHATSRDLVHWTHEPIALAPDSLGYIFSGSAVLDTANRSGLGTRDNPPLVALYTYHDMAAEKAGRVPYQSQALAFSTDSGRTWRKYHGNPVLPNPGAVKDFRDPKVTWDVERQQWVMALAVADHAELWGSRDLLAWRKLSEFGAGVGNHAGVWECPDFIPMRVEGRTTSKWVLIQSINPGHPNGGSGTQYFVGDFDGTTFTVDARFASDVQNGNGVWLDHGRDDYAGVTWANAPNGRVVFMGWMSNWSYAQQVPTSSWRSAMTLPRELTLHETSMGYRIASRPVAELAALRDSSGIASNDVAIDGRRDLLPPGALTGAIEITAEFDVAPGNAIRMGFELFNSAGDRYRIGYDSHQRTFFSDRTKAGPNEFSKDFAPRVSIAPRVSHERVVTFHLVIDVASAELFADGGLTTMTEIFFPTERFDRLSLFSDGGKTSVRSVRVYPLRAR